MPTKRIIPNRKYYLSSQFELEERLVVKPLLKNNLPIIKNPSTTTNIKTKRKLQTKYGILSQQITTQKLLGKSYEDAPL